MTFTQRQLLIYGSAVLVACFVGYHARVEAARANSLSRSVRSAAYLASGVEVAWDRALSYDELSDRHVAGLFPAPSSPSLNKHGAFRDIWGGIITFHSASNPDRFLMKFTKVPKRDCVTFAVEVAKRTLNPLQVSIGGDHPFYDKTNRQAIRSACGHTARRTTVTFRGPPLPLASDHTSTGGSRRPEHQNPCPCDPGDVNASR